MLPLHFCDISNVVVSEENNAVYFLGYGAFLDPVYGGSLYFEDSIPLENIMTVQLINCFLPNWIKKLEDTFHME